jgi:hypothetical protein
MNSILRSSELVFKKGQTLGYVGSTSQKEKEPSDIIVLPRERSHSSVMIIRLSSDDSVILISLICSKDISRRKEVIHKTVRSLDWS